MKYIVSRTSDYRHYGDLPPCEEAYKDKATHYVETTFESIEEAKQMDWTQDKILKIENQQIVAYDKELSEVWVIDINSLEELNNFIDKYGDIVIKISEYKEIPLEIEIYDDYRE